MVAAAEQRPVENPGGTLVRVIQKGRIDIGTFGGGEYSVSFTVCKIRPLFDAT